jgi:hypothetical protein
MIFDPLASISFQNTTSFFSSDESRRSQEMDFYFFKNRRAVAFESSGEKDSECNYLYLLHQNPNDLV